MGHHRGRVKIAAEASRQFAADCPKSGTHIALTRAVDLTDGSRSGMWRRNHIFILGRRPVGRYAPRKILREGRVGGNSEHFCRQPAFAIVGGFGRRLLSGTARNSKRRFSAAAMRRTMATVCP